MFVINKADNSIKALERKNFSDLGFKERAHLQEWIAKNPDCLGEKLLIIQKEFNGFSDTYERLDLLALDKNGNLVIIENKLDDSGRDVTWQALKYASYCSTLTKEDIRSMYQSYLGSNEQAVEKLAEFFDGAEYDDILLNQRMTQRIMLVAANFRKEVTSTVLWLMNFKIQLQCFKVTPYRLEETIFLTLEQIIPTKDAQDYQISMANKAQEEIHTEEEVKSRHKVRLEFWNALLKEIKGKSSLFQNSSATKDHWLVAGGTDITHLTYQLVVNMNSASVMLNFGRTSAEENKALFDALRQHAESIEAKFEAPLTWERMDAFKSSKVIYSMPGVNYFNREDWPKIISFLIAAINKLEAATRPYLPEIKKQLKNAEVETVEM